MREKDVERQCDKIMQRLGWTVIRLSQARPSRVTAGLPDRRYYPPRPRWRPFWMEVKTPEGIQSPAQKDFQVLVWLCGEHYVLGGTEELYAHLRQCGVIA